MAQTVISTGATVGDGTGTKARDAGAIINGNFAELFENNRFVTPQQHGVVEGSVSAAQRVLNGVAFQNAILAAHSSFTGAGKTLYVPAGTYEIDLPGGLEVNKYGARWIGTRASHIVQYANNTPIITFGQKNTSTASETAAQVIDGLSVRYGNVQLSTNTLSNAVVFSRVWMGTYKNFDIGDVNQQYPNAKYMFRGVWMTNNFFFSNCLENFRIKHFFSVGIGFTVQGTGNSFTNIYVSNGNLNQTIGTVSACVSLDANGAVIQENVWNQLNLEWSNVFYGISMNNARNQVFNSLHVEGVHLRGIDPYFRHNSSASAVYNGLTLLNCQPTTNEGSIFGMGWDSSVTVNLMTTENFNNTSSKTIHIVRHDTGSSVRRPSIKILQARFGSNSILSTADSTTIDTSGGTSYDQSRPLKEFSNVLPMTPGLSTIGDVDLVVLGPAYRHTIRANTALTANRVITLSNKWNSAVGLTLPNGCQHRIWRTAAATGAFTLTVNTSTNADGSSPTLIKTLAAGEYIDVTLEGGVWIKTGEGSIS